MSKFKINLQKPHANSGVTPYRVAKDLGISKSTVHRYVDADQVILSKVESVVVEMANYYGVNWIDVVEVVSDDEEEEVSLPTVA